MGVSESSREAFADRLSIVLGWELEPSEWEVVTDALAAARDALDAGDSAEAKRLLLVIEASGPLRMGEVRFSEAGTSPPPRDVPEILNHIVDPPPGATRK